MHSPLIAILFGFLPGCGPQIVVATFYLNGYIPLSAELGNAISNDGDALFPVQLQSIFCTFVLKPVQQLLFVERAESHAPAGSQLSRSAWIRTIPRAVFPIEASARTARKHSRRASARAS